MAEPKQLCVWNLLEFLCTVRPKPTISFYYLMDFVAYTRKKIWHSTDKLNKWQWRLSKIAVVLQKKTC